MKRLLYVFEFADKAELPIAKKTDNLWGYTQKHLQETTDMQVKTAFGFFVDRKENRFAFRRIFNFLFMHVCAPFQILFSRADIIFVRSTPPLIQITYAFWATLFRRKKIFWLMDYHPVFGVRTTKKGSFINLIWRFFDKIDRYFLKKFDLVVCIDEAMQELVKERAPNVETFVCPTFSLQEAKWLDLSKFEDGNAPIKLLYNGNLGSAHSIDRLKIFLEELSKSRKIEFCYSGDSKYAKLLFQQMCAELGIEFKHFGFVKNYAELGNFYKQNDFDYGIVLLNDELQGIVSPSKFSGYTAFGLPIIYLGPSGTNAHFVCDKLNAGVCAKTKEQIIEAAKKVSSPNLRNIHAMSTKETTSYFSPSAAEKLSLKLKDFAKK